jgi:hypothetical protein
LLIRCNYRRTPLPACPAGERVCCLARTGRHRARPLPACPAGEAVQWLSSGTSSPAARGGRGRGEASGPAKGRDRFLASELPHQPHKAAGVRGSRELGHPGRIAADTAQRRDEGRLEPEWGKAPRRLGISPHSVQGLQGGTSRARRAKGHRRATGSHRRGLGSGRIPRSCAARSFPCPGVRL